MVRKRCGQPKMTRKRQVVQQVEEIGLKKENVMEDQSDAML